MIIYNGREYTTRYMETDEIVMEINSQMSLKDLLSKLRAGEDISDVAAVTSYATKDGLFVRQGEIAREDTSNSERILSDEELEEFMDEETEEGERSQVFKAFEAYQFNHPWRSMPFRTIDYDAKLVAANICAAIGIMPTLIPIADKSVDELLQLSAIGDRLYWPFVEINASNRLPELSDIEFYQSLTDYEKRIINTSGVHPQKMLDLARFLKDKDKNRLLTTENERRMHRFSEIPEAISWMSTVPGLTENEFSRIFPEMKNYDDAKLCAWADVDVRMANAIDRSSRTKDIFLCIQKFRNYLVEDNQIDFSENIHDNRTYASEHNLDENWIKSADFSTFATVMHQNHVAKDENWARGLYQDSTASAYSKMVNFYRELWENEFIPAHENGYRQEDMEEFAKEKAKPLVPEIIKKSDAFFKELYRGHSPRVLSEYVYAQLMVHGWDVHNVTDAQLRQIAEEFSQTSVSKIAKYKNEALFALSSVLNFAEIRAEHAEAMGIFITAKDVKLLLDKDFVAWYNKHRDTNTSDFVELLCQYDNIARFDVNKSAKDIVFELKNARGISEARKMEGKYNYRFADNELAIKGRHVVATQGKMKMYMLQADDYRNFTIGIDTHCCQRYGDAGETCVYKYTTDPFAGAVVIERNGDILAQGFVWTDEVTSTLVFDNVEFANDREVGQFSDLFAAWVEACPYQNVHVGTGYNQSMRGWGKQIEASEQATLPTTVDNVQHTHWGNGNCYSDYHSDARTLKRDGQMLVGTRTPVRVTTKPDEPTRWDILARPETAIWLNDCSRSIEERMQFAQQFLENPSPELQMDAVRRNINVIKYLENPCDEVQMYVVRQNRQYAQYIQNPCYQVQEILVNDNPNYIRKINNPSEAMALRAVQSNGLLLEAIPNPSEEVMKAAVMENGYAIKFIRQPSEELQRLAIRRSPRVISMIPYASDNIKRLAVSEDPHVIKLIREPSLELQTLAINADPYIIHEIDHPDRRVVRRAVEKDGLLIRNFQFQYPELRTAALQSNGYAIRALKNPTPEEWVIAVRQDRNVSRLIREPQLLADVLAEVDGTRGHDDNEMDFS